MPLIITALTLFCNQLYTQENITLDRINPVPSVILQNNLNNHLSASELPYKWKTNVLLPASFSRIDRNSNFFDSLKVKASRGKLSDRIYDLLVVSPSNPATVQTEGESEGSYSVVAGRKIRNIEINRLSVFGTNVKKQGTDDPNKAEKFLNKTHINTLEAIIRKNLLFKSGDTISPLLLSDNERILREISFIDDAIIEVVPISEDEADIRVITKDIYSLAAAYSYRSISAGTLSIFEKNIFGFGHEFGVDLPYDSRFTDSPGIGFHYLVNNIAKSFTNLNVYYSTGLGKETYGFNLTKQLLSATTKYAGGISVRQMYTTEDLDTLPTPEPLKYNLQDYWLSRSFLLNRESATRLIVGARYTNNNVFDRPFILPESYYYLQNYKIYLASAALSVQKYFKTSLIYGYGRTEDVPNGGLYRITAGREINEFKTRTYLGADVATGQYISNAGYFYVSAGIGAFIRQNQTEQGTLAVRLNCFSDLMQLGRFRMRNFVNVEYVRGFDRYNDEFLRFKEINGFEGFRNDSINGTQRLTLGIESVLFSPVNFYGFRFAFFGFADYAFLSETNEYIKDGHNLAGIGLGVRVRNDNLLFNTLQVRIGFFPNPPDYSRTSIITVSGEQLLRASKFDPGPPSIISYR